MCNVWLTSIQKILTLFFNLNAHIQPCNVCKELWHTLDVTLHIRAEIVKVRSNGKSPRGIPLVRAKLQKQHILAPSIPTNTDGSWCVCITERCILLTAKVAHTWVKTTTPMIKVHVLHFFFTSVNLSFFYENWAFLLNRAHLLCFWCA